MASVAVSTVTQLLELMYDISQSLDYRKQTDLILLDYSKAFDCVPHKKLIRKLQCTIGEGPSVNWIENYLSDHYNSCIFITKIPL